jgi:tetratricopeptide (TPR) repeat protein
MAKTLRLLTLLILVGLTGAWHWFEPAARKVAQGLEAFGKGQYDQSLAAFVSAKGDAPDSALLRFNTAASLLRMEKYQEVLDELAEVEGKKGVTPSDLHYNKGNAHFALKQYQEALEAFKRSLLADPHDMQAKRNLELTLKKIKEEEQNRKEPEQQNQDDQQQKQDQHRDTMEYLNQNEREQQKKQRQKEAVIIGLEKDW